MRKITPIAITTASLPASQPSGLVNGKTHKQTESTLRLKALLHAHEGLFTTCGLAREHGELLTKLGGHRQYMDKLVDDARRGSQRRAECKDLQSLSTTSYVRVWNTKIRNEQGEVETVPLCGACRKVMKKRGLYLPQKPGRPKGSTKRNAEEAANAQPRRCAECDKPHGVPPKEERKKNKNNFKNNEKKRKFDETELTTELLL